jgi:uncharacterized protein YjbI with pentapeptide repeats/uncharacterized RDD family membrane protein YckC
MTSSTARKEIYHSKPGVQRYPTAIPLLVRRCGAWAIEVSLIAASAVIPLVVGGYTQSHSVGKAVPLNALITTAQQTAGQLLAIPIRPERKTVSPLTNVWWSTALILPWLVAGWQIYLLAKTGKTLPKRWLGVQVVTASGSPPGFKPAMVREVAGRWGLPVGVAYTIWRLGGAMPDLGILTGLVGIFLVADAVVGLFHPQRRTFHDQLASTFIVDAEGGIPTAERFEGSKFSSDQWHPEDEDAAIAAIVLTPDTPWQPRGLGVWMRRHLGMVVLLGSATVLGLVLVTFTGTQVYIQLQENSRHRQQQETEALLQLVRKFASDEQQGAILALGTLDQPNSQIQLLADLLSLESNPKLIETITQALVSSGPNALPSLHRLNLSLTNDLQQLSAKERQPVELRLQATQRAIAKILNLYNEQIHKADLSRVNLSPTQSEKGSFSLVLDQLNLSGIQLKGAMLARGSFAQSRFYEAGEDNVFGTYDDVVSDLSGAELKEANLAGANLTQVQMNNTNLIRANLQQARLVKAQLNNANLSSAELLEADLSQGLLVKASLTGANLQQANLAGANLQAAKLGQVQAKGANFQGANLTHSEWQNADLSEANFSQTNLQNADFSAAQLSGASFQGTQLQSSNFRNSQLKNTDLRQANLAGADFQGATFIEKHSAQSNQFIQTFAQTPTSTHLEGADFSLAKNLNADQLAYICAQGGIHPKCLSDAQ